MHRVINADVIEGIAELPKGSINTCVTSPPYWGLRDYGTGEWSGGDAECDHKPDGVDRSKKCELERKAEYHNRMKCMESFPKVCLKCGAVRKDDQLGLEPNYEDYVERLVSVFGRLKRVLRDDGTVWLNLGDTYVGKQLMGIPWKVAFALQEDGWFLRQDIIWYKPNTMPESVLDRCTKSHEYIFLLSKSDKYYFDQKSIAEESVRAGAVIRYGKNSKGVLSKEVNKDFPKGSINRIARETVVKETRNKRSVWSISTRSFMGAHFAVFPPTLIVPCILAGCPEGGTVLDPFCGSGTTGIVSVQNGRKFIGIELNPEYAEMARKRIQDVSGNFLSYIGSCVEDG